MLKNWDFMLGYRHSFGTVLVCFWTISLNSPALLAQNVLQPIETIVSTFRRVQSLDLAERRIFLRQAAAGLLSPRISGDLIDSLANSWQQARINEPLILAVHLVHPNPLIAQAQMPWRSLPDIPGFRTDVVLAVVRTGFQALAASPTADLVTAERTAVEFVQAMTERLADEVRPVSSDQNIVLLKQLAQAAGRGAAVMLSDDPARASALLGRVGLTLADASQQPAAAFVQEVLSAFQQTQEEEGYSGATLLTLDTMQTAASDLAQDRPADPGDPTDAVDPEDPVTDPDPDPDFPDDDDDGFGDLPTASPR